MDNQRESPSKEKLVKQPENQVKQPEKQTKQVEIVKEVEVEPISLDEIKFDDVAVLSDEFMPSNSSKVDTVLYKLAEEEEEGQASQEDQQQAWDEERDEIIEAMESKISKTKQRIEE